MAGKGSPGPALYTLPPSVGGKQPDGRKSDPPSWGFGTAQRFRPKSAPPKVDGHAGNNPGPNHYSNPPPSVGPQVLAKFRTEPLPGFGTAERKNVRKVWISQEHQKTDMYGLNSPGPATYALKTTLGRQDESTIPSTPTWVIAGRRNEKGAWKNTPGPAEYTMIPAVGVQPDSRRPSSATPSFGSGTRNQRAKIYLGDGHEKASHGKNTPGPAANYQLIPSVGKQIHSKTRDNPSATFSRASRWASYEREIKKNSTPGPGAY